MHKDHRPYFVKKGYLRLQHFYTRRFLQPQLDRLGQDHVIVKPWHVEVFGGPVRIGRCAFIIAASDGKVRLAVWPSKPGKGSIRIGDYGLICPGVRISSGNRIDIGDNCMLAHGVYITDADWHGIYDRIDFGNSAPVCIEDNVWIGDGAIISKGVTIGANSVIGAGSVVVHDVPANAVAAGNPARVVRRLDPDRKFTTRAHWYADPQRLYRQFDHLDRRMLAGNTLLGWLRYLLFPTRGD